MITLSLLSRVVSSTKMGIKGEGERKALGEGNGYALSMLRTGEHSGVRIHSGYEVRVSSL